MRRQHLHGLITFSLGYHLDGKSRADLEG